MADLIDDISDSYCTVEAIYNTKDLTHNNKKFLFEIEVDYTKVPVEDSDGDPDYLSNGVETVTKHQEQEYGRDCFIGKDEEERKAKVCLILYEIDVPPYRGIVTTFMEEMKSIMESPMENLSKIKVKIEVVVPVYSEEEEEEIGVEDDADLYEVAPAIQQHLENVTEIDNNNNKSVGDCVICMEKIEVGSELVSRIPCEHVFHRNCIAKWLEESAICPLCRHQVFPV